MTCIMRAAGIREFKARLSHYLSAVRQGEVILITDRGEVVAEVRKPLGITSDDPHVRVLLPLVARGEIKLGGPSLTGATLRHGVRTGLSAAVIQRELDAARHDSPLGGDPHS